MNQKNKSNYSITEFVKDVLKKRFPDNVHKQEINDEDFDKLNFACPYCGDSHKDSSKKRGNVYFKTNSFKCFNDGCLTWVPLNKFIAKFASKYSLEIPTLSDAKNIESKVKTSFKKNDLIDFLTDQKIRENLIDFKEIYSRFFLKACIDAPDDSPVGSYVKGRNLLDAPGFEQSCYYDNNQDKIYIFNIDLRSGKILGVSIRVITEGYNGPKYNMKNYSEFIKNGLIRDIDNKDHLYKIDLINNFFNILNISFSKPVVVTEGQINSMFIKNAIATTGVTKSKSVLGTLISKKNAHILFDNDKAGKTETMKLLEEGYKVFMWSKLIHDLKKQYSTSLKDILKINDVNDLYNFYIKVGNKKSIDEFYDIIMSYFSDSIYDLLLV